MPRRGRLAALLLLVVVLASACGSAAGGSPRSSTTTTSSATAASMPSPSPSLPCAEQVLATMTPDQRIGQLFELGLAADRLGPAELNLIQTDHIGSVWFVERSSAGVNGIRAVASAVQAQGSSATTAKVRLFLGANPEGGPIPAVQSPGFSARPSPVGPGSRGPPPVQRP